MQDKTALLPRISINRPVTVTMCLLALLAVGFVAYSRIAVQLFPSGFSPPFLYVRIYYPNATPQESEQQIARPLEETLRTVRGIRRIRTYSRNSGVSAPLDFKKDADMDLAYNQVIDRLERLKPLLPEDAQDNVRVWKYNEEGDQEIMWIGVAIDSTVTDAYTFLEAHVQRPLERIDGIARVTLWGVYQKSVMIEVNGDRARTRGVNNFEIVRALRQDNFALSGGYVNEGGKKFYVRSMARYRSLEEIGNILIKPRSGGIRLRDVADITYDIPERHWFQRIDLKPAASIGIYRESDANIVSVCSRVQAALSKIGSDPAMQGLDFNVFYNQGQFIQESIDNLRNTALWGVWFAALVLFFYLRVVRMTLIIALSIPLCITITLTALYFMDWSLNLLTMMGLMIGVGMVVDNAIVVAENIYRLRAAGMARRDAALQGAGEVSLAITTATLTTVVVFLPLMLMNSDVDMAFYLLRIGVPVIVALLGSLFVALIFIPLAAKQLAGRRIEPDPRAVRWAKARYGRMLGWALGRRRDATLIILAVFATILYPLDHVRKTDRLRGNINDISVRIDPPNHFSLDEISGIVNEIETFLDAHRDAYGIRTMRTQYSKGWGRIQIFLDVDPNEAWWYVAYKDLRNQLGIPVPGQVDRANIIEDMRANIPKFVGVRVGVEGWGRGAKRDPSVSLYLYGEDTEVLADLADEVERRLRALPFVINVDSDLEHAEDEIRIVIDRERARNYKISPRAVGQTVAFGLQGARLPRYQDGDREVSVRLYPAEWDRQTLNHLRNIAIRTGAGEVVPLGAVARLEMGRGSGTIRREDGKTRLWVRAYTTRSDIRTLYAQIEQTMGDLDMPRGYAWDKGERYVRLRESDQALVFAVTLAVTFVFLLMGILFESFILPFSVLFSIPFAFLGVYWTLYLTNTLLDGMARVGVIVLIGVVVNNAIVLVDLINRLRAEGATRTQAILAAGASRFRPILMTTFTTVFGLLPMAVGNSNMVGIPYAPLGRTLIGGLLTSAFLTLFVVPLSYTFLDDLRSFLGRFASALLSQQPPPPPHAVAADDD